MKLQEEDVYNLELNFDRFAAAAAAAAAATAYLRSFSRPPCITFTHCTYHYHIYPTPSRACLPVRIL